MRCAKFGVAVFKASMLDCWGMSICHGYMCIVLYMKLIWCSCFAEIYAYLEEGVGSICHGYMCIVLYKNLFHVMVFQTSMLDWRRGGGVNLP